MRPFFSWGPAALLFCVGVGITGCVDTYGPGYAGPGYGPGYAYRGGPGYGYAGGPGYGYRGGPGYGYAGGPGYGYRGGPGYGYGGGSIVVDVNDRGYYTRGPGYYVGRSYYVWRPGHWANRRGGRVWIHGHYVLRG